MRVALLLWCLAVLALASATSLNFDASQAFAFVRTKTQHPFWIAAPFDISLNTSSVLAMLLECGKYHLLLSDRAEKIFATNCMDPATGKRSLVVDAGANIGVFSLLAASHGCRAVAFEPQIELVELLHRSIRENPGFSDLITVHNVALHDSPRSVTSLWSCGNTNHGFVRILVPESEKGNCVSKREVEVKKIDDFVAEDVLFFKIDVEKQEAAVLRSAEHLFVHYQVLHLAIEDVYDNPEREWLIGWVNDRYEEGSTIEAFDELWTCQQDFMNLASKSIRVLSAFTMLWARKHPLREILISTAEKQILPQSAYQREVDWNSMLAKYEGFHYHGALQTFKSAALLCSTTSNETFSALSTIGVCILNGIVSGRVSIVAPADRDECTWCDGITSARERLDWEIDANEFRKNRHWNPLMPTVRVHKHFLQNEADSVYSRDSILWLGDDVYEDAVAFDGRVRFIMDSARDGGGVPEEGSQDRKEDLASLIALLFQWAVRPTIEVEREVEKWKRELVAAKTNRLIVINVIENDKLHCLDKILSAAKRQSTTNDSVLLMTNSMEAFLKFSSSSGESEKDAWQSQHRWTLPIDGGSEALTAWWLCSEADLAFLPQNSTVARMVPFKQSNKAKLVRVQC